MKKDFYRAFEEKFRGSRELIRKRLEVYLPFLIPLQNSGGQIKALDLGCGRGEWLELLQDLGFDAQGIDIDDAMLEACRERGFNVKTTDALTFLREIADDELAVVSAFHVVEHISFEDLQALVAEAKRVLMPGGLLILETPNPENLVVGTSLFYLDPTHQRPIPSELLAFVAEYAGFGRSKVLRLQESPNLTEDLAPSLLAVLRGPSPDYAVVAQKLGPEALCGGFDHAFSKEYGLSLDVLALRFQCEISQLVENAQRMEAYAQGLENRLTDMLVSRSWRVTAPLRWIVEQLHRIKEDGIKSRFFSLVKKTSYRIEERCTACAGARDRLVILLRKTGLLRIAKRLPSKSGLDRAEAKISPEELTSSGRQTLESLKQAEASRKIGRH